MPRKTEEFENTRCRVKAGWEHAGREADLHATIEIGGRKWAVLVFDGDDDPDMYKAEALEMEGKTWRPL